MVGFVLTNVKVNIDRITMELTVIAGINLPRQSVDGGPLPSPRKVSSTVAVDGNSPSQSFTHLLMQYAQFLDHDLTLLALTKGSLFLLHDLKEIIKM